jgi:Xaa-Pro aminopeptidase
MKPPSGNIARLIARFPELKLDALLITALPNVRYLTGFTGSNALLAITPESWVLFTDSRYEIQAREQVSGPVKVVRMPLAIAAGAWIARKRARRIGFEKTRLLHEDYAVIHDTLRLNSSLVPAPGWVERLRMVKSEDEIARIRRSVLTNPSRYYGKRRRGGTGIPDAPEGR